MLPRPRVPITMCLMSSSRATWAIASAGCPVLTKVLKTHAGRFRFSYRPLESLSRRLRNGLCQSLPIAAPASSMALMFCTLSSTSEVPGF